MVEVKIEDEAPNDRVKVDAVADGVGRGENWGVE